MKTSIKLLFSITLLLIFCVSLFLLNDNNQLKKENNTLQIEKQIIADNSETFEYLNSITLENFNKKVDRKEDIFVYIGNSECSDCSNFSKILKKEVEEFPLKESLYLLNITKFHNQTSKWLEFKEQFHFNQTPAFLIIQDGKTKSIIEWDKNKGLTQKQFHAWLEKNKKDIQK